MERNEREQPQKARFYSIGEFAQLAGCTPRTLRHYEELGIIAPQRAENGYRIYGEADVKRLAQVLAMKRCGLPLGTIRDMFEDDSRVAAALSAHLSTLVEQMGVMQEEIARTKAALSKIERIEKMNAEQTLEEMKRQGLEKFERTYGREARERYGTEAIEEANERMMSLTQEQWDAKEDLEEAIKRQLAKAMDTGDPTSKTSAKLADMHAQWIRIHWGEGYSVEAHRGLADGYLADSRFVEYYDGAAGEGATEFLVAALKANLPE